MDQRHIFCTSLVVFASRACPGHDMHLPVGLGRALRPAVFLAGQQAQAAFKFNAIDVSAVQMPEPCLWIKSFAAMQDAAIVKDHHLSSLEFQRDQIVDTAG